MYWGTGAWHLLRDFIYIAFHPYRDLAMVIIITPILQIGKLRLRRGKWLSQGSKWQIWGWNLNFQDSKSWHSTPHPHGPTPPYWQNHREDGLQAVQCLSHFALTLLTACFHLYSLLQGWRDSYLPIVLSPGALSSEVLPQQQSMPGDCGAMLIKFWGKEWWAGCSSAGLPTK